MLLTNFLHYKKELPLKNWEQISYKNRKRIEEHMLIVMDKSTHEEHLPQPLQTNKKHFKIVVFFLTAYNGIFNVKNKNNKFYFNTSFSDIERSFIIIPPGDYDLETLDAEIKRICINDGPFREKYYPFKIKPNFSILGSIIDIDVGVAR